MRVIFNKFAAVLALAIGLMAVVAGGKVLLGIQPDYYVIDWLPVYNFSMGLITVMITTALLWINHRRAVTAAAITLVAHSFVMTILQTAYSDVVAPDSIRAMTIRISVWLVILILLAGNRWKVAAAQPAERTDAGLTGK